MGDFMLASAGNDIRFWDVNGSYSLVKQFNPHSRNVCDLAWSLDNSALASLGQEDKVVLTYTNSSSSAYNIAVGENRSCLAFSSNSRYIIAGGKDGTLNVCDLKTNKLRRVYKGHNGTVTSISFNYNDQDIASGSETGDILLHNTTSGTMSSPLRNPKVQAVRRIQYSHFRKSLLGAVSDDGALNLWDTHRRQLVHSFSDTHKAPATDLSFSPFNQMLVMSVGLDKRIICYDVCNQTSVKTMMAESPLTAIEITPDGATVAVGSTRGKVYIYDLRQAESPVHTLVGHKSSVQVLKFQNRRDDTKVERISKSRSGSASRASNRNANLPTPQENVQQNCGDINANDTNTAGVLSDRTNCNTTTQPAAITKPMDADVFSPIRDMSLSPRPGANPEQKSNTAANGKVSLGGPNNSTEEQLSSVFSPISGDLSGHAALAVNGTASRISPAVSSGEVRPAPNGVPHVAPQQMQAEFQQYMSSETSGMLRNRDNASSMPDLKRRASSERKPMRDMERRSSGSSDSMASDVRPMTGVETSVPSSAVRFQNQGRDLFPSSSHIRATSVPAHMETCGAAAAAAAVAPEAPTVAPFHMELMRNMVEEAMEELREEIHKDTLSLHVEIIKQFQIQQAEFQAMLQRYSVNEELMAEIERLREENKRLKQNF